MRNANVMTLLVSASALLLCAPQARAQLGSGWTGYDPPSVIHMELHDVLTAYPGNSTMLNNGGASYDIVDGVEVFQLLNNTSNRVERRLQNDYTSGTWQFEGEVRVWPPTDNESVMQVWGGKSASATTQMIRAFAANGGTLRRYDSFDLVTNIYGLWVQVNVIHDVAADTVYTYINGVLKSKYPGQAPSSWYHKYGCYGTLHTENAKVEWRNVKSFKDGTVPTADMPVMPDQDGGGTPVVVGDGGGANPPPPNPPVPGDAGEDAGAEGGAGGGDAGSSAAQDGGGGPVGVDAGAADAGATTGGTDTGTASSGGDGAEVTGGTGDGAGGAGCAVAGEARGAPEMLGLWTLVAFAVGYERRRRSGRRCLPAPVDDGPLRGGR